MAFNLYLIEAAAKTAVQAREQGGVIETMAMNALHAAATPEAILEMCNRIKNTESFRSEMFMQKDDPFYWRNHGATCYE